MIPSSIYAFDPSEFWGRRVWLGKKRAYETNCSLHAALTATWEFAEAETVFVPIEIEPR